MPRLSSHRLPAYRFHKARGLAVVTLNGQTHYLGPYCTHASRDQYDQLISQWIANGRRPLVLGCRTADLTLAEICALCWR